MDYSGIQIGGADTGAARNLTKRLGIIHKHLDVRGKRTLDCGCGAGQYVLALLERGADAYGIEYNPEKVAQFHRDRPEHAGRVVGGNIERMVLPSESFDFALMNEVLEHVPNESAALQEVRRVLKPNGLLMVFSPNRLYPFETHSVRLKRRSTRLPLYIPFIPYVPLAVGNHLFDYLARNYWPRQLRRQIRACGYQILNSGYVWQTFENISGEQPKLLAGVAPVMRAMFNVLERIPGIKAFGVSQVILAQK